MDIPGFCISRKKIANKVSASPDLYSACPCVYLWRIRILPVAKPDIVIKSNISSNEESSFNCGHLEVVKDDSKEIIIKIFGPE